MSNFECLDVNVFQVSDVKNAKKHEAGLDKIIRFSPISSNRRIELGKAAMQQFSYSTFLFVQPFWLNDILTKMVCDNVLFNLEGLNQLPKSCNHFSQDILHFSNFSLGISIIRMLKETLNGLSRKKI